MITVQIQGSYLQGVEPQLQKLRDSQFSLAEELAVKLENHAEAIHKLKLDIKGKRKLAINILIFLSIFGVLLLSGGIYYLWAGTEEDLQSRLPITIIAWAIFTVAAVLIARRSYLIINGLEKKLKSYIAVNENGEFSLGFSKLVV